MSFLLLCSANLVQTLDNVVGFGYSSPTQMLAFGHDCQNCYMEREMSYGEM